MMDQRAASRGRPLLLAIRVPDSLALSRDLGLDVETWLAEGLVDSMAVSDYYRLTPWRDAVQSGHRYDVPVYACLSESRLKIEDGKPEPLRNTLEAYRGRALNAWQDGVDGIYLFNLFDPTSPLWREAGDPALLSTRNRIYFASVRGMGGANWRVPNAHRYRTLPLLTPERITGSHINVRGEMMEVPIDCGGDLTTVRAIELRLRIANLDDPAGVAVRWNGRWLPTGVLHDGVLRLPLTPEDIRPAENRAGLVLTGASGPIWDDIQIWMAAECSLAQMEQQLRVPAI